MLQGTSSNPSIRSSASQADLQGAEPVDQDLEEVKGSRQGPNQGGQAEGGEAQRQGQAVKAQGSQQALGGPDWHLKDHHRSEEPGAHENARKSNSQLLPTSLLLPATQPIWKAPITPQAQQGAVRMASSRFHVTGRHILCAAANRAAV